jgi:phospholipid/cholesterol/gamma-HCH transport system permease protein
MATQTTAPSNAVAKLGEWVVEAINGFGQFAQFTASVFAWMIRRRSYPGTLVSTMFNIGVRSVPVVAITGTFIGMVLAVQAFNQFRLMHIESRLGAVINASVLTELGPVLAATMLAGRIGSAMAAELATMKVTEQIDGLRALGVDPTHYLAVPRLVACIVLIPLLTSIADFMGVLGGALVAVKINHVAEFHYWQHSRETVELWDIGNGLVKSLFFGVEIAVISCFCGFRAGAGAEGVGRAATEAFVYSFVAILVSDFFLGMFINSLYMSFWPVTTSKLGG